MNVSGLRWMYVTGLRWMYENEVHAYVVDVVDDDDRGDMLWKRMQVMEECQQWVEDGTDMAMVMTCVMVVDESKLFDGEL